MPHRTRHVRPTTERNLKVAIVHDHLNAYGGAERVLDELHAMYPDAPVFVDLYDPTRLPAHYRTWDIRPSWLNRIKALRRRHQPLLPILPAIYESMDLEGYDVVLSDPSGFCKGVLTNPETCHISYCHSPPRFLWDFQRYAEREKLGRVSRSVLAPMLPRLRAWDRAAADRVDYYVATSGLVQARIDKFYRRPSVVIPPPVNASTFQASAVDDGYYLMLMRLVGWKRPDIVVEACTRLGLPLVVAGGGRDEARLRRLAGPTVRFVGPVWDDEIRELYARCRAFILPAIEDFGITPLEAMASGKPVIAVGAGGVLDTVIPGVTGTFFAEQTVEAVVATLQEFDPRSYDPTRIRAHAEQFDAPIFRKRLRAEIDRCVADHAARHSGFMSASRGRERPVLAATG